MTQNPWLDNDMDAEGYDARMAAAADAAIAEGRTPHGEADCVMRLGPVSVLDAGCGSGRVAIELAQRGIDVMGVDLDPSMVDVARRKAPHVRFEIADLATMELGRTFDAIVLAGNVMIFLTPGTLTTVVANLARHLAPGGHVVAGWDQQGGPSGHPLPVETYDLAATAAGLTLVDRFATWEGDPYDGRGFAVSVHRRDA